MTTAVTESPSTASCRFCRAPLRTTVADLGMQPLSNAFLAPGELNRMEPFYPLRAYVCEECFLVQLEEFVAPAQIFSEYLYFSSYSASWLEHARAYVDMIIPRARLTPQSAIVEIGSNDGYLLQYFVERGFSVLGVEPAANVAAAAVRRGVATRVAFFDERTAREMLAEGLPADLIVANNVLAQVPEVNGFVAALKTLLARAGTATLEFPHLLHLMTLNQFDTIYHEHFSYFSLMSAQKIFTAHGLTIFDVEELPTHGGSLRLYLRHAEDEARPIGDAVWRVEAKERAAGLDRVETYRGFEEGVRRTKRRLLEFLVRVKEEGQTVAGYGAPAKGNTLLNYCGIRSDFLEYTVDRNPDKQGRFLPGTHIPIFDPGRISHTRPNYVLILPWNLKDEIMEQMAYIREWGGRFVTPIPEMRVHP